MRACGVELVGNEAIISIIQLENGLYDVPKVRTTKLILPDAINTDPIKKFQFDFSPRFAATPTSVTERSPRG